MLLLKLYRLIKDAIELDKSLQRYLDNKFDEKSKIEIAITCCKMNITAHLSSRTIKKYPDIENVIVEYIRNYYPGFNKYKIAIKIVEQEPELKNEQKIQNNIEKANQKIDSLNNVPKDTELPPKKAKPRPRRRPTRQPKKKEI